MNLRHPKVIRLGGWGALLSTLLAVAAGAFLASTFFQAGDLLSGSIAGGITAASGLFGGLLVYCLFLFASMAPPAAEAPVADTGTDATDLEDPDQMPAVDTADSPEVIAIPSAAEAPLPPELSDEAMPVFAELGSTSSDAEHDESNFDLLIAPPTSDAEGTSDPAAVEPVAEVESIADFDSRTDIPAAIDAAGTAPDELPERSDDVDAPSTPAQNSTSPVVSALTPTDEFDVIEGAVGSEPKTAPEPAPAPPAKPSPVQAFPDIFKSPAPKAGATAAEASTPPPAPSTPAPPAPIDKIAPTVTAKVAVEPRPAAPARPANAPRRPVVAQSPASPAPVDDDDPVSLPVVADLSDIATTLTPAPPAGGVLPSEIPDFFLKMPTGRPMPAAMPLMPIAPVTPRPVAPTRTQTAAPPAVRIIDSSSSAVPTDDDLVTMTAIPDDWPS